MNPVRDELGAHVSTAGGIHKAPERAAALNSRVTALFTKVANQWREPTITPDQARDFHTACATHGIDTILAHDSYLINLATPDEALAAKSYGSFLAELQRCNSLGIQYVVTHPGNATDKDAPRGIAQNSRLVARALEEAGGEVAVLFETTAGTGTALGASFQELAALLDAIPDPLRDRVGVCFDTCHIYSAGYDIVTDYAGVMDEFDRVVGLSALRAFHLNGSKHPHGSRKDRHEEIGHHACTLGLEPFRSLLNDDRVRQVPKVIETPKGKDHTESDLRNLDALRALRLT